MGTGWALVKAELWVRVPTPVPDLAAAARDLAQKALDPPTQDPI